MNLPTTQTPLYQQLYDHLRGAILAGQLEKGAKLPSTRALAEEMGVSRNTVLNAYEQLIAEGYLETVEGKGTFVTNWLAELTPVETADISRPPAPRAHRLSNHVQTLLRSPYMPPISNRFGRGQLAFRAGMPALDAFPYEQWAALVSRHAHAMHRASLPYGEVAGYRPLREAIANYLIVARQVRCTPEQVLIVSGSQGALYLASRVLLNSGDCAWMEDPGYLGARGALLASGAEVVPVPVDDEGLVVDEGIRRAPHARLTYVTPSHQFPLGRTMSLQRRLRLLHWAHQENAYILEDDYDGEYRYGGRPIASLQGLDTHDSVIYIGTFSKVLFPSLRLGYLVVPPTLVDAFIAMRRAVDYASPGLEQAVLAEFIADGHFTRHIRRMRTLYAERRAMLLDAARHLPLEIDAPHTGMHLIGWLPDGADDVAVARQAAQHGVYVAPVSRFAIQPTRPGVIMGYAASDADEIEQGIQRLSAALKDLGI